MAESTGLWTPTEESCMQILNLLQVLRIPGTPQYAEAQAALEQFKQNEEFVLYLSYIMVDCVSQVGEDVRQLSGLLMKNILKKHYKEMGQSHQKYIKEQLVRGVQDATSHSVRSTAGTCITTIVATIKLETWPDLLPALAALLDAPDPNQVDGAFNTLQKICEDSAYKLQSEALGQPLGVLIPKFLHFFTSAHAPFRRSAVLCLNNLILLLPSALVANMQTYLQGLSSLAADPCPEVRKGVCQAIVMLLDIYVEALMPHMPSIIEFMLRATEDTEDEVALEAAEFWPSYCESQYPIHEALVPYLPRLLPVLLSKMVFSEDEIAGFDDAQQDESVPDRAEDIRPMFHKSKVHGRGGDDDDGDDEVSNWTLRKSVATGLDIICVTFQADQLLPVLLPELQNRLASSEVWIRESALLALGALAHGCMNGIAAHLPQLFPFLLAQLNDQTPQVRSIACWTLSRYCGWVTYQENHDQYLKPLMEGLLQRILDRHKKVQEAACSAFSNLEEEAGPILEHYLEGIIENLLLAMNKYQTRSLIILFDTIGTLADSMGQVLNKPQLVQAIMPSLMAKWDSFGESDKQLFPLLECITSLAQSFGPGFQDYAPTVYERCLRYIEGTLLAYATCEQTGIDPPDKEFIVCPLDLLSGMADGLKSSFEVLATDNLVPLLYECLKDQSPDVRQSALALVGEMAKNCTSLLLPALPKFLPEMIANLNPTIASLCNNASWSIGETAIKVGGDTMRTFGPEILNILVRLVNDDDISPGLLENCSITLGRFGLICPDLIGPLLEHFFTRWCVGMSYIQSREEKISATHGMCYAIQANTTAFSKAFEPFCFHAVGSWHNPHHAPIPDDLKNILRQLLVGFKSSTGDNWNSYWGALPEDLRHYLSQTLSI